MCLAVFSAKLVECKKQCLLNNFLATAENRTRQRGRVIDDLRSPDTFDTRVGEC